MAKRPATTPKRRATRKPQASTARLKPAGKARSTAGSRATSGKQGPGRGTRKAQASGTTAKRPAGSKPAARRAAPKAEPRPPKTSARATPPGKPRRSLTAARTRAPAAPARPGKDRNDALDRDRSPAAARTGRRELLERLHDHPETSPALTGGDIDADWTGAYSQGDEAPGG